MGHCELPKPQVEGLVGRELADVRVHFGVLAVIESLPGRSPALPRISYGYALRASEQNLTLTQAMASGVSDDLPDGVQRLDPVLAATYANVLGSTDPSTQPSDRANAQTTADQLDNCGP